MSYGDLSAAIMREIRKTQQSDRGGETPSRGRAGDNHMKVEAADLPRRLTTIQMNGAAFQRVFDRLSSPGLDRSVYVEVVAGLNALAYRLLSCAEASRVFTAAIGGDGGAPPFPARYSQEIALFDFFVNGACAIESLAYSLHSIAFAIEDGRQLSMDERRMRYITPGTVQKYYFENYGSEKLTLSFGQIINAATFAEWKRIRNVLVHRGTPGRDIAVGIGVESSGTKWRVGISLNGTTTSDRLKWLRGGVNPVLEDLSDFLAKYLPKGRTNRVLTS
jgi:hypothetical protein